jgi:hypothetical protein
MKSIRTAAAAAAVLLACALPAAAQMGAATNGTNAMSESAMPVTCQGMMDKAMPMSSSMADGNKKMMAMKQMDMAKMAMGKGDEKMCVSHMKMAMKDMM